MSNELEDLIKEKLPKSRETATGYYPVKCPMCKDHKVRAGFRFDADKITYHCFRGKCDYTNAAIYEYGKYMVRRFRDVLKKFDVHAPAKYLTVKPTTITQELDKTLYEPHHYEKVKLQENFTRYNPSKNVEYKKYLDSRLASDTDYYVGHKGDWRNKLIIPFYFKDDLIGWQGIDIRTGRFLNSSGNTNMLYLPYKEVPSEPIIVEGIFDAKSIPNGVATLHSTVTKRQAYILKNSKPILVPDRKGSNYLSIAKNYGWRISIPAWKEKDINEAEKKYGKLVIAKMIHDGITKTYAEAEVKYGLWKIRQ